MADIKDYGELYTSDILVVGGGMAGLVTAIRAKENDPTLDILVIDKGIIGWNGQATKAGNGIRSTSKHPNGVKNALEYGRLIHVLPDYTFAQQGIYAVYPDAQHVSAKVRVFIDYLRTRAG